MTGGANIRIFAMFIVMIFFSIINWTAFNFATTVKIERVDSDRVLVSLRTYGEEEVVHNVPGIPPAPAPHFNSDVETVNMRTLKISKPLPDRSFKPSFTSEKTICKVPLKIEPLLPFIISDKKYNYQCIRQISSAISSDQLCQPKIMKSIKPKVVCSSIDKFETVMKARRQRIKDQCQALLKRDREFLSQRPKELFHFWDLDGKSITWCPVYKAGSSNTNAYFCPIYYSRSVCSNNHYNGARLWRYSDFYPPDNLTTSSTFMITRNPLDRLLSAYRDKIEVGVGRDGARMYIDMMVYDMMASNRYVPPQNVHKKKEYLKSARYKLDMYLKGYKQERDPENPYEEPIVPTFTEFVHAVLTGTNNEHWRSSAETCGVCNPDNDFRYILKVEDYDCEFNNFLESANISFLRSLHEEGWQTNRNPNRDKGRDFYEYYGQLSHELLDRVHKFYERDCLLFGYDCGKMICEVKTWKKLNKPMFTE